MKFLFSLLLISLQISLYSQDNTFENQLSQKQIITESMLKAAGTQSLSDILFLADKWNFYTIDGYERGVSANNLSSFQRQNFIVLIDGQKIDDKIFDVQNINDLPISIDQVSYVEFINTPQIYNGEFTEGGLINIHTKVPSKGLSAQGFYGVGDQTGDPGPYAFTNYKSPNVDKLGYYLSLNTNLSTKYFFFKAAIKTEQNFATDPEINDRVSNLFPYYNKAKLNSVYYKFNFNFLKGSHQLMIGNTRHYDFFFFKPYGNEIPANLYFKHAGLSGSINPMKEFGINYSIIYSGVDAGQWDNKSNLDFNFQSENYEAFLEGNYESELIFDKAGVGFKSLSAQFPSASDKKNFQLKKFYNQFDLKLSKDFIQSLDLFLVNCNNKTVVKGAIRNSWNLGRSGTINASYTFSKRLLEEDANYWFWLEQGYALKAPQNLSPDILGNFNSEELYTADLNYIKIIDSSWNFELGINFRQFSNFYVEQQVYQYFNSASSFYAPVEIFTDAQLKVIGFSAGIENKLLPHLTQKIFYSYQKDVWGSQLYRDVWQTIPVHKFSYTINFVPVNDFGIWAKLRYLSGTMWVDYKYANLQTNGKYISEVRPLLNFDLSINKWFWNRKIWANVLFRNIFNQSENYIPIGVSNTLRFYIQIQLYFNSIM